MRKITQKPEYLTPEESANCYATNRGWVILKPNGKYDIVEAIRDLDKRIAAEKEADSTVASDVKPVSEAPEELTQAIAKLSRVEVLEQAVAEKKAELADVTAQIESATPIAEVLEKTVTESVSTVAETVTPAVESVSTVEEVVEPAATSTEEVKE